MSERLTVVAILPATHLEQRINVWSWQHDQTWRARTELLSSDAQGVKRIIAHEYATEPDAIEACRREAERMTVMAALEST